MTPLSQTLAMSKVQGLMFRQMLRFQTAFLAATLLLLAAPGPAKAEFLSGSGQIGAGALGAGTATIVLVGTKNYPVSTPGTSAGTDYPLAPGGAAGRAAGRVAANSVENSQALGSIFTGGSSAGFRATAMFGNVSDLFIIGVATVSSSTSTSSTSSTSSSSGTAP